MIKSCFSYQQASTKLWTKLEKACEVIKFDPKDWF